MIDEYKQAFLEEAHELLPRLEAALLELDQNHDDRESIATAFRALHTLKGTGAMCGYENIASFAHDLEDAFDRLRDGRLTVTSDLISLALAASDQIKIMAEEPDGGVAVDARRSVSILENLHKLTGLPGHPAETVSSAPLKPVLQHLTPDEIPGEEVEGCGATSGEPKAEVPAARKTEAARTSAGIRVSAEKLDQLVNLAGELVTVQARLSEFAAHHNDAEIAEISSSVDRLTAALRENSMSIRMLPLKPTFERFRRLVRDLSVELHKEVELVSEGADTEVDKTVIDQLSDPLVHLIRNSMDHGIETPEVRRAAGKNSTGTIQLWAGQSGAHVLIRVSDDGRGLDIDAIRARAVERGLLVSGVAISDAEAFALIQEPGFSTVRMVTSVSGRGVGMDVVRRSLEALRGSIEVSNHPGKGLSITLRLPLTLAIIDGLLVRVGASHFVLPLANSLGCVELTREDILAAHGKHIAQVHGEVIPYIRLSECFQMDTIRPEREQIMIVETDHGHYGLVVDEVIGERQTVIKSLGRLYRHVQMVSGATILGNGTAALILDPHRLVQHALQASDRKRKR